MTLGHYEASRCELGEAVYQYDLAFGPEAGQEQVYDQAVAPICGAAIQGYNGAVIAYGQTGSGKTHTVVGSARFKGIAPRAINAIFAALQKCQCWTVEVSVLEIYNERVRDLLATASGISHVDVHEVKNEHQGMSFRCPEATHRVAAVPEDALAALSDGMKRRETARTDMNHNSSRSHLILTLTITQSDPEIGATLRGRLHLVDLAGSERLKRSMASEQSPHGRQGSRGPTAGSGRTPRDQRREAGEINKSLSQLALVIQRLTNSAYSSLHMVPYRDSMLTRLLAESFGGSSKTCLIITCSAQAVDREETRCSLEFGKRAKLVKNKAEINLEVACEPSPVMQALVAKEMEELYHEKEEMMRERQALIADRDATKEQLRSAQSRLSDAAAEVLWNQEKYAAEVQCLEDENSAIQHRWIKDITEAAAVQEESVAEVVRIQCKARLLHEQLAQATAQLARTEHERAAERLLHEGMDAELRKRLSEQQRALESSTTQAAGLHRQLLRLGQEEAAALAELRQEGALERAQWQDEVSRLERENVEAAERFEEEKVFLEHRMWLQFQESAQPPAKKTVAVDLQEVEVGAQEAEELGASSVAELAMRGAALRNCLEDAAAHAGRWEEARRERIAALETQTAQLQKKWGRPPLPGVGREVPAQAVVARVNLTELEQVPTPGCLEREGSSVALEFQGSLISSYSEVAPSTAKFHQVATDALGHSDSASLSAPTLPPATRLFKVSPPGWKTWLQDERSA